MSALNNECRKCCEPLELGETYCKDCKGILNAIMGSIEKWHNIITRTGKDHGTHNCPLCDMFYYYECYGCPVWRVSGRSNCSNTPYTNWRTYLIHEGQMFPHYVIDEQSKQLAIKELEFLESLLPGDPYVSVYM
jgi:hypothetical protein